MADMHKKIIVAVMTDWSISNRGRLQELKQGVAIPIGNFKKGNFTPMHFGADNGTPDLFGDEVKYERCIFSDPHRGGRYFECFQCGDCTDEEVKEKYLGIVPCYIEVKTIAYPKLSKDQINFMNAQKARGSRCYVAMENEDKSEKLYSLREWGIE